MEYKCSVCNFTSSYKVAIERHITKQKKCGENQVVIEIPIDIKCEYCNKSYKTKEVLIKHFKICKTKNIQNDVLNTNEDTQSLLDKIKKLEDENSLLKIETKKPNYKSKLNSVLRFAVWNSVIGHKVAVHKCLCCNSNEISQQNFDCGHIVSRNNGGEDIIDNLVPICGSCNSSMGSIDMDSFIKTLTVSNN